MSTDTGTETTMGTLLADGAVESITVRGLQLTPETEYESTRMAYKFNGRAQGHSVDDVESLARTLMAYVKRRRELEGS